MAHNPPLTLNIIGCGKAGSVLAFLWNQEGIFEIGGVLTRTLDSASHAVNKIGAGRAVSSFDDLGGAELFMIAVPDQQIKNVAARLAASGVVGSQSTVFHLSGALESSVLAEAGLARARVASVHPLRSFAEFDKSIADFGGTWCGFEGCAEIQSQLESAFENIGARMFLIEPNSKLLYHSASVITSNYVNALVDAALSTYQLAGIHRDIAQELIKPILRNTCENILATDPGTALTGPIARGDWQIVSKELEQLESVDRRLADVYRAMARATLALAKSKKLLTDTQVSELERLLS